MMYPKICLEKVSRVSTPDFSFRVRGDEDLGGVQRVDVQMLASSHEEAGLLPLVTLDRKLSQKRYKGSRARFSKNEIK
jgi:hypothetical protein